MKYYKCSHTYITLAFINEIARDLGKEEHFNVALFLNSHNYSDFCSNYRDYFEFEFINEHPKAVYYGLSDSGFVKFWINIDNLDENVVGIVIL